ncbi:unnamed protein product [Cyprideis torosa]|uniref:Uncharacterized protein n=1 Tax=Cyprideis torosa TaxID=163714 RepID=A0A7R8WND0_9CRUS|nr:unnamed protein product [Cyprideis torosa]CAG0906081.1 unnamed protein product [Cyprideis torosa]
MKSLMICLVLGFLYSTPGNASCPGRYEAVSYQLGSERKESCYFVSTDYVRWEDGTLFCSRHHGGYLAEFVCLAEWKAFKTFFTNIPQTTKEQLYDTHVWIGASHVVGRNVWKWNGSEADFSQIVPRSQIPELELTPLKDLPEGDSYGLTVKVHSELEKTKELLRERDEMISSLQRELEASRKTTALPATTEATTSLEQPPKPQEQAADFLIPNMTFAFDYLGEYENGEAKSYVVEAGGLRWRVSFWASGWTRFLLHAEGGRGAPSPWTLTVQFLTVKVLRKGREGGEPVTYRLEGATFSSQKGVVGMLSGWSWSELTDPSWGFLHPQGRLHLEVSFEGAAMSPSPPPQRPTVWEAEATLQLRNLTSSLREDGDRIYSPSVHVGGKEWRVRVDRLSGGYDFSLQCNPEERSAWSLEVDWTISLLSADGGWGKEEEKRDGEEVSREYPYTYALYIPRASVDRFLTGDTLSVAVKIRVHH